MIEIKRKFKDPYLVIGKKAHRPFFVNFLRAVMAYGTLVPLETDVQDGEGRPSRSDHRVAYISVDLLSNGNLIPTGILTTLLLPVSKLGSFSTIGKKFLARRKVTTRRTPIRRLFREP